MYTDFLGLNPACAILVPMANGAALAQGCHDVLSVLGVMFRSSGMGEAFGCAITLGAHRIKTLHGHSDEGSYIRKVSRRCSGGVLYGAIPVDVGRDMALPSPSRSGNGLSRLPG